MCSQLVVLKKRKDVKEWDQAAEADADSLL